MSCLSNLIGQRTKCTTDTPSSGLFIEDLGITAAECDDYINGDYESGEELIADKIEFASKLISQTITNNFQNEIKSHSLIDSATIGTYQDNLQPKSGIANTLGGISLTLNNYRSYQNIYVNTISLQVDYTGDIDVKVYNLITGELLDSTTISCLPNVINTKQINKTYKSNKQKLDLIFVYDTEGITSINTSIGNVPCPSCTGYKINNSFVNYASVSISEDATKIRSSLSNVSHTFGLSINYSVQCSLDTWICEISNLVALPLLYKVGIEIMNYSLMASKRINSSTNIDVERNKERLNLWMNEYNNSLAASIGRMKIPNDTDCFYCYSKQQTKIILP